jgi:6-phosphogluconolactonase
MSTAPEIRVLSTPDELFQAAGDEFTQLAKTTARARGKFCVALSGGSTPKGLFQRLASLPPASIPWDAICFFWGDERHVPVDHPENNYRRAFETLLSKVPVRRENIFRIRSEEENAEDAAKAYEQTLQTFFGLKPGEFPSFDLILLGMGPDGHAASLFPGSSALKEQHRLVIANWVEKFHTHRITLTLPVLNHARSVIFLVCGQEKAPALRQALEGNGGAPLPSQLVRPTDGRVLWLVDRAAASGLSGRN